VCKPTGGAASSCGIVERCVSTCRANGAACIDETCRKPLAKLRCGKATCAGDKPACCGVPAGCRADADCRNQGEPRYRCAVPSDCLEGEHCARTAMGTHCTRLLDPANAGVVCEREKDCPKDLCQGQSARPKCAVDGDDWFKTCVCP
jgi:hypothetical protein